jgi:hypothetical protein
VRIATKDVENGVLRARQATTGVEVVYYALLIMTGLLPREQVPM